MNRKKRLLPLLMALLLIVSYLPVMRSYAAECIVRGDNHTPWNSVQDGVFTYDGGTMTITTSNGSLTGAADNNGTREYYSNSYSFPERWIYCTVSGEWQSSNVEQ